MIYCVIPRELADELFDKMVEYYKDNPNVTVIVDRREGSDRRQTKRPASERRIRDRRGRRGEVVPQLHRGRVGGRVGRRDVRLGRARERRRARELPALGGRRRR